MVDIETNGLENPDQIWVIVCKDIDTGELHVFRHVTSDANALAEFNNFANSVDTWIGHNILGYDIPVILRLCNQPNGLHEIWALYSGPAGADDKRSFIDTLIISKMADYSRKGHSIEAYGEEFTYQKGLFTDFSKYSKEMEAYCVRDVEISEKVYTKYKRYINNPDYQKAIRLEHSFQLVVNDLHDNGFAFDHVKATALRLKVECELTTLDEPIAKAFPPKLKLVREINPRVTKHGTLNLTDFRFDSSGDLSIYNGGPFCRCAWVPFNPASHKQIVDVLSDAQWSPIEKTDTHIECERTIRNAQYSRKGETQVDLSVYVAKLKTLEKYGWKISENNLLTLPDNAPPAAKLLAKRILLESRRRTLTEWLNLVRFVIKIEPDHNGTFGIKTSGTLILNGVNANAKRIEDGVETTLKNPGQVTGRVILNTLTVSPWKTLLECLKSKGVNVLSVEEQSSSLLITVIGQEQYEVCYAILATEVWDGTRNIRVKHKVTSNRIHGKFYGLGAWSGRMAHQNPNTANIPTEAKLFGKEMRSLWIAPKNRLLVGVDAEGIQLRIFAHYINDKEFIDALVNGRKEDKTDPHSLNQRILLAKSRNIAKRFIFAYLLGGGIPKLAQILEITPDEARGALDRLMDRYTGLQLLKDTIIPADAKRGWFYGLDGRPVKIPGETASGRRHLCMSGYLQNGEAVVVKGMAVKAQPRILRVDATAKLVNIVHDEKIIECSNNFDRALEIAKISAICLKEVGEELKLNCPLAGSFWNDDAKDYTIGVNWYQTH